MTMTIDERALKCAEDIDRSETKGPAEIIARHLREAVEERDALLNECRTDLGVIGRKLKALGHGDRECAKLIRSIDAMLGEQA